jgi:ATP-binding cassette subfamily B multidrug efflux pump
MKRPVFPFTKTLRNFLPLKEYFWQNRWPVMLGLTCLLVVDFLQLLIPLVIKSAVDLLTLQTATSRTLFQHGMIIVLIAFMMSCFRYAWRHLILGHSRKVEEGLRNRIYGHLQTLSSSFFQRTKTGDIMARAVNDINAVRMATGMGVVALTDGIILGMAAIGFMMSINVKLMLISLIPAPIIVVLTRILTRQMSAGFEEAQKTFADLNERVRETFAGIRVVKAYCREDWEYERVRKIGGRYIAVNMNLAKTFAFFFPIMTIFTNIGLVIVIWLGGRLTILGNITTGDFVAFIGYLNLLTWPMMAMGWVTNLMQRGSASMRRITGILEELPQIRDPVCCGPCPMIKGKIEIKGLNIIYPGLADYALKDINMKVDAGETVAVVGRVGSGKTTLMNVIPRILEVPPQTVFVDDKDVRQISLETLRGNLAFVPQEVFVFSDTVRNNVLFGRGGISAEELEAALKAADILEDIQGFEKGLETVLGERGVTLSGGQRQRLTIARALIVTPPILILDDALSMVDTRTEERILNQILGLRRDKTNLIVSHRVSTIRRADRIIVLDRGEVADQGTYEELLGLGGVFASLYDEYTRSEVAGELDIRA